MRRLTALLLTGTIAAGLAVGCGAAGNHAANSDAGAQTAESDAGSKAENGSAGSGAADSENAGQAAENTGESRTTVPGAELAAEEEILSEGAVFNIYCIGEDFKSRVQDYYPEYEVTGDDTGVIGQTQVRWHMYSDAGEYRDDLDEMLDGLTETGGEGSTDDAWADVQADDRVDLFVVDEAFLDDYVESGRSLDVTGDLGITPSELADQFPYTQEMATDGEGRLKALTWQATPGVFAYRRSIARKVLGTDNPEKVQEAVSDWERTSILQNGRNRPASSFRTAIRTARSSGARSGERTIRATAKSSVSSIPAGGSSILLRARRKETAETKRKRTIRQARQAIMRCAEARNRAITAASGSSRRLGPTTGNWQDRS